MANISANECASRQNNHNLPRKQTLSGTNIVIRIAKQRACQNLESVKVTQKNEIDAKLFVCDLKHLSKVLKQF